MTFTKVLNQCSAIANITLIKRIQSRMITETAYTVGIVKTAMRRVHTRKMCYKEENILTKHYFVCICLSVYCVQCVYVKTLNTTKIMR